MTNERITWNPRPDDTLVMIACIDTCSGPNKVCRKAHKAGLQVHIIPASYKEDPGTLVLPTNHYASVDEAKIAYINARFNAYVVHTRTERDAAYARNDTIWVSRDIDLNA